MILDRAGTATRILTAGGGPAGKMENYEMAKRFKAAYPNLFEGKYNSDVTFLRATQEQRYAAPRPRRIYAAPLTMHTAPHSARASMRGPRTGP